eukprot:457641-Prymnesium_polylepis.2
MSLGWPSRLPTGDGSTTVSLTFAALAPLLVRKSFRSIMHFRRFRLRFSPDIRVTFAYYPPRAWVAVAARETAFV